MGNQDKTNKGKAITDLIIFSHRYPNINAITDAPRIVPMMFKSRHKSKNDGLYNAIAIYPPIDAISEIYG